MRPAWPALRVCPSRPEGIARPLLAAAGRNLHAPARPAQPPHRRGGMGRCERSIPRSTGRPPAEFVSKELIPLFLFLSSSLHEPKQNNAEGRRKDKIILPIG